jgi:hypothetical protein
MDRFEQARLMQLGMAAAKLLTKDKMVAMQVLDAVDSYDKDRKYDIDTDTIIFTSEDKHEIEMVIWKEKSTGKEIGVNKPVVMLGLNHTKYGYELYKRVNFYMTDYKDFKYEETLEWKNPLVERDIYTLNMNIKHDVNIFIYAKDFEDKIENKEEHLILYAVVFKKDYLLKRFEKVNVDNINYDLPLINFELFKNHNKE